MGPPKVSKIGKYEVLDVIGRGGMGMVYKAVDPTIGRTVAIKKVTAVLSDDPDLLKRFYREAQSTGKLQHPNIVTLHDLGDQDGVPYLVMEYLEGDSLEKIIRERRPYSLAEKLNIIIQVCEGLGYAHQRQIVHRDMKPGNIVVLNDGGVKIVDFGIAQLGNERFTRTGQVVGSLYYMSPEQIQDADIDARSDIYSTAVVLFEFLAGVLPFHGKDPTSTLAKILHDAPPSLANFIKTYPAELDDVVQRALAKDRNNRYTSMEDLVFDLQTVQEKLSRDLIASYLRTAEVHIETRDWDKARDHLRQVLKLDKQHRRASELLREVQTQIHRQQIGEQVRQLRGRADEALRMRQWDQALTLLDQAVRIDGTNSDLITFRDSVRRNSALLVDALRRAESAHSAGDLDNAKRAIEEALTVDPYDTTAKALNAIVAKEIAERTKRKMIDEFVIGARKEIAMRHFTAALDILRKAQTVDASVGEVQQLIQTATAGREHERKRVALEQACTDIEDLLNRDEYAAACVKADEALQEFPQDLGLLKLRSFAEKQREAWTRRQFIETQMKAARQFLDSGQLIRAQGVLNEALERYADDSGLISLLSIVADAMGRQEAQRREAERQAAEKRRYIQLQLSAAAELQGAGQTAQALKKLRDALFHYPDSEELKSRAATVEDLLAREQAARERAEAEKRQKRAEIEKEIEASRQLLAGKQTGEAVLMLEQALRRHPDSEDLKSQLEFAQRRLAVGQAERERAEQEARRKRAEIEREVATAQQCLDSRQTERAVKSLELALSQYPENEALRSLHEVAQKRLGAERSEQEKAAQEAKRRQAWIDAEITATREWLNTRQAGRAVSALEQALKQYPENQELRSQLEVALDRQSQEKAQQERAEQEARRRQEEEREIAAAWKLLDAGQTGEAVTLLEQSVRKFPDSKQLRSQLELARQRFAEQEAERQRLEFEARRKRAEIEKEIANARQLLETRQANRAVSVLELALRRYPDSEELKSQLEAARRRQAIEKADQERAEQEARHRQAEIEREVEAARQLLSAARTHEAVAALEQAAGKFPDNRELKSLLEQAKQRLAEEESEKRRLALERQRKQTEIAGAIAQARKLLESNQADRAVEALQTILRRYPGEEGLKAELQSAQRQQTLEQEERKRTEEERGRRQAEMERAVTAARQLLSSAPSAQAVGGLELAARKFPESKELKSFLEQARQRLAAEEAEKRRLALEAQLKQGEIAGAIAQSRKWLDSKQAAQAVAALEQIYRKYPDSSELKSQLEAARERKAVEQAERERAEREARARQEEISKQLGAARQLLQANQTANAITILDQAARKFPESGELQTELDLARKRLAREQEEKARAEEQARRRKAEIEGQLKSARQLLQSSQTAKAVEVLTQAARNFPDSAELKADLRTAQQQLEKERAEQEKKAREAQARTESIAAAVENAKRLLKADETSKALALLEQAVQNYPEADELRSQLATARKKLAQEQAEREQAEKRRAQIEEEKRQAESLLSIGKPEAAIKALEQALKTLGKDPQLQQLLQSARAAAKQKKAEDQKQAEELRRAGEQKRRRDRDLTELRNLAGSIPAGVKLSAIERSFKRAQEIERKYPSDAEIQEAAARASEALQSALAALREKEQAQAQPATRISKPAETAGTTAALAERTESEPKPHPKPQPMLPKWAIGAAAVGVLAIGGIVVKVLTTPKTYMVTIETQPAGATVQVGGKSCVTPSCQLSMPAGNYQMDVQMPGYKPATQPLIVDAHQPPAPISIALVRVETPVKGTYLVVQAGVDGAQVLIDGKRWAEQTRGGVVRLKLDAGDHTVEVQKTGYVPAKPVHVRLQKDEEASVSFILTPLPTRAALLIAAAAPNAQVLADGHYLGLISQNGSFSGDVDPGSHEVVLLQDGRRSSSVRENFVAGKSNSLDGSRFKFAPLPPSLAVVNLRNLPAGASIRVDSREAHQADSSGSARIELQPGPHTFDISADGFMARKLQQTLIAGPSTLDGTLQAIDFEAQDWMKVQSSSDMAALQGFLNSYPKGRNAEQAESRLEKLIASNESESDLRNFSNRFSRTPAADKARNRADVLRATASQQAAVQHQRELDVQAIQSLLGQYRTAYEQRDFKTLTALYPGLSPAAQKATQAKFKEAASVQMELSHEIPQVDGDQASVKVTQTVNWTQRGGAQSTDKTPKLTWQLVKKEGRWLIQKGP